MSIKTSSRPPNAKGPTAKASPRSDARFDVANRVFFRLYQTSNLMHRTGTRAVSTHGATTQQWAVMGALARTAYLDDGMSVKELMAFLAVSRQSLTIVLNRLEGLALVERVRVDGDGRVRRIRLTSHGRASWTRMLTDIHAYYAAAIDGLSTADAQLLFTLLDRLLNNLRSLDVPEPTS
ncbi:MAG: MarR family transcriptional regulator [Hyphomicrobiaceae bacterium]|nr:MarR family transcriptional regulator [Hyphomicrobiaceae bacterium]